MANVISTLRQSLVADLESQFPDAEVSSGERSGKSADKPRIAVFWPGFAEMGSNVTVGQATMLIRYWPPSPKLRDDSPSGVRDPSDLEQAAWDLATFLQTKQTQYTAASGAWFIRLQSVEIDYDPEEWGVQATVVAMFDNPAVIA